MLAPGRSLNTARASAASAALRCWMAIKAQVTEDLDRGAPGRVKGKGPGPKLVALGVLVQMGLARRGKLDCDTAPAPLPQGCSRSWASRRTYMAPTP